MDAIRNIAAQTIPSDQLAIILETMGDAVIVIDATQKILVVNAETERIFGRSRASLLGRSVRLIMPGRYHVHHDAAFEKRVATSDPMPIRHVEVQALRADGSEFPIQVRFARTKLNGRDVFIAAMRDISDLVKQREVLARRAKEVEDARDAIARERDYLREEMRSNLGGGSFVRKSHAMVRVVQKIEAVAPTNAAVLIHGESGVGKELIAQMLHDKSHRKSKPLIRVNCASIPSQLFESEFFGHTRGSFTGAIKDRTGRFQLADGGTIFLDEVGEIPLDLQGKLLRVLQEMQFERVGEDRTRSVDVRVIAATNRDLLAESEAGRFRVDLYYRLSVFPIEVPPLRERRADIGPLARHFIEVSARKARLGKTPSISNAQLRSLEQYDWPGNVRELQNVVERAVIVASGGKVDVASALRGRQARDTPRELGAERTKAELLATLDKHNGVIARAARDLGLSRQALYRRLELHGIDLGAYKSRSR